MPADETSGGADSAREVSDVPSASVKPSDSKKTAAWLRDAKVLSIVDMGPAVIKNQAIADNRRLLPRE
jgi:hypothetical protein